ncbi:MAG: alcohol dehydrogenase catalytic domain-containing protein [Aminipila sp.]
MFSRMIKVVEPLRFEEYITCLEQKEEELLVRPQFLSICKADMRYYLGMREHNVLALKYPFCLIHEAIGEVARESQSGSIKKNDRVALIPNIPPRCEENKDCSYICADLSLGKNYCPQALFASSNYDGFLREHVLYKEENLVKLPTNKNDAVYVFSELISVACSAIRRTNMDEFDEIVVWGSGNMAYIIGAVIKYYYEKEVIVVGRNETRLKQFSFCETISNLQIKNKLCKRTLFFECVGGNNSQQAINQIINQAPIGSGIVLMGVPDVNPEINIRLVLEKGLIIKGTTRSDKMDFVNAVKCFDNQLFRKNIENLIIDIIEISNVYDVQKCFELEKTERQLGKHLMKLNL